MNHTFFYTYIRTSIAALVVAAACILLTLAPAHAREQGFRPAIGEVEATSIGTERAVVEQDGGLSLYAQDGALLSGFPVFATDAVFSSSPLILDIDGDGANEVAVVGRNAGSEYTAYVYNGDGTLFGSTPLTGHSVHYDPVRTTVPNIQSEYMLLATNEGDVVQVWYKNGALTSFTILPGSEPLAVSVVGVDNNMVLSFPQQSKLERYSTSGKETVTTASPVIYPLTEHASGNLYSVSQSGQLMGFDGTSLAMLAGFPVALSGFPVGAPIATDIDPDAPGEELVVEFSNGTNAVYNTSGTLLSSPDTEPSFANEQRSTSDASGGIFGMIRSYASTIVEKTTKTISSVYSRIRFALSSQPEIAVFRGDVELASGAAYNVGTISTGQSESVTFVVKNLGLGELALTGTPIVEVTGAHANEFAVTSQPNATIAGEGESNVVVAFTPTSGGLKSAQLSIANSDSDESVYTIDLTGSGQQTTSLSVVPSADVTQGVAPLVVNFSAAASGGQVSAPTPIDLATHTLDSYGGSPGDGDGSEGTGVIETNEDGDTQVYLTGNSWKKIDFPYSMTPDTMLAFDYRSTAQADIQGIGMTELHDQMVNGLQSFKLFGSEAWGIEDFNTYGDVGQNHSLGEWKHYEIPVGSFYTADTQYLFFINDHDKPQWTSDSMFKNVAVYESSATVVYTYEWDFGDGSPVSTDPSPAHQYTDIGEYIVSVTVSDGAQEATQNLTITVDAGSVSSTVYEDAEDGTTDGWLITDNTPDGATITNVFEDSIHGNVIQLTGTKIKNSFTLNTADGSLWGNTAQYNMRWDMNFAGTYYMYVHIQTSNGPRLLIYTSKPATSVGGNLYVDAPIYDDGLWHTMTRDLQADLEAQEPGAVLTSVDSFSLRGSGKIDGVMLSE